MNIQLLPVRPAKSSMSETVLKIGAAARMLLFDAAVIGEYQDLLLMAAAIGWIVSSAGSDGVVHTTQAVIVEGFRDGEIRDGHVQISLSRSSIAWTFAGVSCMRGRE